MTDTPLLPPLILGDLPPGRALGAAVGAPRVGRALGSSSTTAGAAAGVPQVPAPGGARPLQTVWDGDFGDGDFGDDYFGGHLVVVPELGTLAVRGS